MKNLLTIFLAICFLQANATHNRAGEITYKRIAPFTQVQNSISVPVYHYSITVTKYTDYGIGIADRCVDTVYFGDGSRDIAPRINGPSSCNCGTVACGEIIVNEPGYIVKKNIYSVTHTYPGPGNYIISSTDPNRNQGIFNIPNSINHPFYIESMLVISNSVVNNFSSVLTKAPVYKAIQGTCFYHNPGAYDEEGDSLSYEITTSRGTNGQTIPGYSYPAGANYSVDHRGLLTWCTPDIQAEYQLALLVKEWRKVGCGARQLAGYVLRDFQVLVGSPPATSFSAGIVADTCIAAGKTISRTYTCNSQVAMEAGLYGPTVLDSNPAASITPTTGSGVFSVQYNWQSACHHVRMLPYQVNLVFRPSAGGQHVYRNFNVRVVPPSPVIKSVQSDTSRVTIKWKSVQTCLPDLIHYKIYRKIGPVTWQPGPCETGVPPASGFALHAYVSASDSSFEDTEIWTMPNGSMGNYIVTAVAADCIESFADTVISLPLIVGLNKRSISAENINIFPNPFHNSIHVELSGNIPGNIVYSLYAVDGKQVLSGSWPDQQRLEIPSASLAPGLYILQIRTGNGTVFKKVVKE